MNILHRLMLQGNTTQFLVNQYYIIEKKNIIIFIPLTILYFIFQMKVGMYWVYKWYVSF